MGPGVLIAGGLFRGEGRSARGSFGGCGFRGRGGGGLGVGDGLVDGLEELAAIDYFNKGRPLGVGGGDPAGGGVFDADALAEGVVGLDLGGQLALRVEGERQGDSVALGELFSELGQDIGSGNGDLVGEDFVAVVVAELFALGVEPAGVDRGLEALRMEGQREVVADPRNVVLGGGFFEQGVGAAAVGALHIFKFDDGDAGSGGRLEGGGVVDLGSGGWGNELCVRGGRKGERGGDEGKAGGAQS